MATDIGSVVAVYGAGVTLNSFVQPLSTSIVGYRSPTQVKLAAAAGQTIAWSPRTVWGPDHTASLQAAIDKVADAGGGVVELGPGHSLVSALVLPCSRSGVKACMRSYNNIMIRGAGREVTILENWDTNVTHAIIELGFSAETPSLEGGNARLHGFTLRDLTLRQVDHAGSPNAKALSSYATEDVEIANVSITGATVECLVMGAGAKSIRWYIHDNVFADCGNGGAWAGYLRSSAALNLNGSSWLAERNIVRASGQAVEMCGRHNILRNNVFDGMGVAATPKIGLNLSSCGVGAWDNLVHGNIFLNGYYVQVLNVLGTVNRTYILDNVFVDCGVSVAGGRDANTVIEEETDTVVHGHSVIARNVFLVASSSVGMAIQLGDSTSQGGKESVTVRDNALVLQGSPGVGLLALARYGTGNGRALVANNTMTGSAETVSGGREIDIQIGTSRTALRVVNLISNFGWRMQDQVTPTNSKVIAAGKYSDPE